MNRSDADRALREMLTASPPSEPLTADEYSWFRARLMESTIEVASLLRQRFAGYQFPTPELFEDHRHAILTQAEHGQPTQPLEWIAKSRALLERGGR